MNIYVRHILISRKDFYINSIKTKHEVKAIAPLFANKHCVNITTGKRGIRWVFQLEFPKDYQEERHPLTFGFSTSPNCQEGLNNL